MDERASETRNRTSGHRARLRKRLLEAGPRVSTIMS